MLFNKYKESFTETSLIAIFSFLTACGPVKFSASSTGTTTPDPKTPTTPAQSTNLRDVHYNNTVAPQNYKLDIVLVVDDSNSMLTDNQKLAAHLSGLITKLESSNIDWQMCATVTRALPVSATQTAWGASVYWQPNPIASTATPDTSLGIVLKKGAQNLSGVFTNTINYIGAGWINSDDERAIKAAYNHVYNGDYHYQPNSGCYRSDSAIAYIIISDEDERSVGGDASQKVYPNELQPLEDQDKASVFTSYVQQTFGKDRRFTVNSIIVKPGDSDCKATQDAQGAISHYGAKYQELSNLTAGGIGSICDSDYSANMDLFFGKIQNSLSSVPLECAPYNGNVTVNITPTIGTVKSSIQGQNLVFDVPVPDGHTIDLTYQCADNRTPSSIGKATLVSKETGFWMKIVSFFKNLF
ncbi:MAG: hypothetical protein ACXWR0_04230 [Bdellovibrio sp.]